MPPKARDGVDRYTAFRSGLPAVDDRQVFVGMVGERKVQDKDVRAAFRGRLTIVVAIQVSSIALKPVCWKPSGSDRHAASRRTRPNRRRHAAPADNESCPHYTCRSSL